MSIFGLYSAYYDLLYADKDYGEEVSYVLKNLGAADRSMHLLELGCGTGGHAAWIAQQGHRITGIDMSKDMLTHANRLKGNLATEAAALLDFQLGDARSFRSGETYDGVVSLFHVMSYLNTNKDLRAAFLTAAAHLKPGGLFVFDYWFGPGVLNLRPSVRVRRLASDDMSITRIAEPEHLPTENTVVVRYEIQMEPADGKLERVNESHRMRYLFLPEIEYLSADWFRPVAHYGWMSSSAPGERDWAGFTVLERLP